MEVETRAELTVTSVQTRNKKLSQVLANRELFIKDLRDFKNELGSNERSFQESQEEDMVRLSYPSRILKESPKRGFT